MALFARDDLMALLAREDIMILAVVAALIVICGAALWFTSRRR
jgi:hypothetical protein